MLFNVFLALTTLLELFIQVFIWVFLALQSRETQVGSQLLHS